MPIVLADNDNVVTQLTSNISTNSSTVPIPAIAGGTAAGVVLAVVAVMGWKWWTSIARNTNKHQSSGQNVLRKRSRRTPAILNEELPASSTDRNSAGSSDCKKDLADSPLNTITCPHPTTPHQCSLITAAPTLSEPPIKPPACAMRRPSKENTGRGSRASFVRTSNALSYKSSTISTPSMYSTQSGEQQQARVPVAAIVAALGHTLGTRHFSTLNHNSEPYTIGEEQVELTIPRSKQRLPAYSNDVDQIRRISNISAGSLGLQWGSASIAPIGVAYGGEESEEPFHEKWLVTGESDVPAGSLNYEIAPPGEHSTGLH